MISLVYGGCGSVALDHRPCPCVDGYVCCASTDQCLAAKDVGSCPDLGGMGGVQNQSGQSGSGESGSKPGGQGGSASGVGSAGAPVAAGGAFPVGGAGADGGNSDGGVGNAAGAAGEAGAGGEGAGWGRGWHPIAEAPIGGRTDHAAVWAGDATGHGKLVIYGGQDNLSDLHVLGDGALYDPAKDTWKLMTPATPRVSFAAVWTGERVLFWGGAGTNVNVPGEIYDPENDLWQQMAQCPFGDMPTGAPYAQWTSKYLLLWSRGHGVRYEPVTDTWSRMSSSGAPYGVDGPPVWTGARWIFWGGWDWPSLQTGTSQLTNRGAVYDPESDTWTPLPVTENTPPPRRQFASLWNGEDMLLWGGTDADANQLRGRIDVYNPGTNQWSLFSFEAMDDPYGVAAVAVPSVHSFYFWGGLPDGPAVIPPHHLFDWVAGHWWEMTRDAEPPWRQEHTTTWTGAELIVWGGWRPNPGFLNGGGAYVP